METYAGHLISSLCTEHEGSLACLLDSDLGEKFRSRQILDNAQALTFFLGAGPELKLSRYLLRVQVQHLCKEGKGIVGVNEGGQCGVVDVASGEKCKRVTSDTLREVVKLQNNENEDFKSMK